ncbi:hypothetical protein BLNAU_2215 [Blattamonas nauphoetae]|uniref:riboflavin kinase n=1 Tax=Blattamonas nauphoetae TaxID=2049346 RepID=A0ABQ9YGJ7_9EUKA|nr:hypothetical protein BLNAU_2215 [Blattamonas nauphoetae]
MTVQYPVLFEGKVLRGLGLGSSKAVPTVNIDPDSNVALISQLGSGVFAGFLWIGETSSKNDYQRQGFLSVFHIGIAVGHDELTLEVNIIDDSYSGEDCHNKYAFLLCVGKIRDQLKFENSDEGFALLRQQIKSDVSTAHKMLEDNISFGSTLLSSVSDLTT